MKIDLKEIEKSLVTFKDEVLTKAKEGVATTDELSAMEKSFDEKMATQLKEMGKRKASLGDYR